MNMQIIRLQLIFVDSTLLSVVEGLLPQLQTVKKIVIMGSPLKQNSRYLHIDDMLTHMSGMPSTNLSSHLQNKHAHTRTRTRFHAHAQHTHKQAKTHIDKVLYTFGYFFLLMLVFVFICFDFGRYFHIPNIFGANRIWSLLYLWHHR